MTLLAAVAAFATALTVLMPVLSRDRLDTRMQVMATERDKMRAARLADLAKKDGQGRLRTAPKGFMQEIVDQLNLRSMFDTEEVRDKLKMAGLRGQAPLVAYMFFRVAMPIIVAVVALVYLFVIADYDYPRARQDRPGRRRRLSSASTCRTCSSQNLVQRRQTSIKNAFPDALDMLLICVQSGMSVEAAFRKVSGEVGSQSLELAEELSPDHRRAFLPAGPPPGFREPRQAHRHSRHQGGGHRADPGRALRHAGRPGAARHGARKTATCACPRPRRRPPPCRRS